MLRQGLALVSLRGRVKITRSEDRISRGSWTLRRHSLIRTCPHRDLDVVRK